MPDIKGERLYVRLGPSQVRKRLRGVGFGVRRVESAGTGRALIIHTATGGHLEQLKALFGDVLEELDEGHQGPDGGL
ncbi:MAG: hypothetical protein ACYC6Y_04720 [Thermoguttaceae bacterium]